MASRLGRDESGMGGGAPVFRFGADSEVTADGRFVGTGGTGSLLLKPISSADRRGGGAITLFARSLEACLWGNDGGSRVDCLGGNEGLAGRSTYHFSVTFSKSASFERSLKGLTAFWTVSDHYKQAQNHLGLLLLTWRQFRRQSLAGHIFTFTPHSVQSSFTLFGVFWFSFWWQRWQF
jgi:hypothetical protein